MVAAKVLCMNDEISWFISRLFVRKFMSIVCFVFGKKV